MALQVFSAAYASTSTSDLAICGDSAECCMDPLVSERLYIDWLPTAEPAVHIEDERVIVVQGRTGFYLDLRYKTARQGEADTVAWATAGWKTLQPVSEGQGAPAPARHQWQNVRQLINCIAVIQTLAHASLPSLTRIGYIAKTPVDTILRPETKPTTTLPTRAASRRSRTAMCSNEARCGDPRRERSPTTKSYGADYRSREIKMHRCGS